MTMIDGIPVRQGETIDAENYLKLAYPTKYVAYYEENLPFYFRPQVTTIGEYFTREDAVKAIMEYGFDIGTVNAWISVMGEEKEIRECSFDDDFGTGRIISIGDYVVGRFDIEEVKR